MPKQYDPFSDCYVEVPGHIATPAHKESIWASDFIPLRFKPATEEEIVLSEQNWDIALPKALRDELFVQNGGIIIATNPRKFENEYRRFLNRHRGLEDSTVDGVLEVARWDWARESDWFMNYEDILAVDRLLVIAMHSASHLCLDYSKNDRSPSVVYIDLDASSPYNLLFDTVEEFVGRIKYFKSQYAIPALKEED